MIGERIPSSIEGSMHRPWWRSLASAAAVATLLSALAVVTSQPTDKMAKYYKRTGQKFLDEKSKVVHVGSAALAPPGARGKIPVSRALSHLTGLHVVCRRRGCTNCPRVCCTEC